MAISTPEPQVICRHQYDWDGESDLSMAVLDAVADATGADLLDLPPLYESIDPDALEGVFTQNSGSIQAEGSVSFEFAGHPITVRSTGEIVVYST